jgi:hypothetical protein
MDNPKLVASLQKLAKDFGTEVLSLPIHIFPHKKRAPRAYTDARGIPKVSSIPQAIPSGG